MDKLRVMTIVGTRPEIIRLSRVMVELDKYFEHIIVHTGQNYDYELNEVFFADLEIRKPDYFLEAAGKSAAETIGNVIALSDKAFEKFQPDALLILGDTNSCLSAISAKRKKIPIFHMEAGNRCFDLRVPEEINRKIVDHISDINLTYSQIARDYLIAEGFAPDQIIKTGSPMKEVINYYLPKIESSDVLARLSLVPGEYFLVSAHREENVDTENGIKKFIAVLAGLSEQYKLPIIVSTHPRTRKQIDKLGIQAPALVQFLKPFGFLDYVKLQMSAKCVLSDSGTITEESSILNFPALNLREVHERPEGFEEGAVMMVGINFDRIVQAINILKPQKQSQYREMKIVKDYDIPNVSLKVVRIIQSYTDFVNRKVWKKIH
jgi:UDP-N-acetylglucosamine 2-epimerase (non-hydrolysing)